MKKILLFVPIMLILCACGTKPAQLKTVFSATAICDYNNIVTEARVESAEHGRLTVEIKKPEEIKGCIYSFTEKGFKMSLEGLEIGGEESCIPPNSFPRVLYNVLADAAKSSEYTGSNNSFAEYKGKCENGEYRIQTDFNTGYISYIEIKSINFKTEFKYG